MKSNANMSKGLTDAVRRLVAEVAKPGEFEALKGAGLGFGEALALIRGRIDWLRQFGTIIGLCGLPPEHSSERDLPLPSLAVSALITGFETGLAEDATLATTPATLSYLLLKSASLRGRTAQMPQLEALFEHWAQRLQPVDAQAVSKLPEDSDNTAEKILLAWLSRWEFDVCEFIALEALDRTCPASLTGTQLERLSELRRKLPGRTRLPVRELPYLPVRIRSNTARDKLQEEVGEDLAGQRALPVYLLRRLDTSERNTYFAVSPDSTRAGLLEQIGGQLRATLRASAQSIVVARHVRNEVVGGTLQGGRDWLEITPARAEENGLVGAGIWVDLELRRLNDEHPDLLWSIYLGVDPAGLGLKAFLDLADAIRNEHEPVVAALARDTHEGIKNILAEHAQKLRRAPLTRNNETGRPV